MSISNNTGAKVNSWNEWDPLKRIIIGRADGTIVQAPEPAAQRNWPDHGFPLGTYGRLPEEMKEKAREQLDSLVWRKYYFSLQIPNYSNIFARLRSSQFIET